MINIKCRYCENIFTTYPSRILKGQGLYCSKLCSNRYNAQTRIKNTSICLTCAKLFHAKGTKQRFCSNKCWIEYKVKNQLATRKGVPMSQESIDKIKKSKKIWFENNVSWNKGLKLPNRSGEKHHYWGKRRQDMEGRNNYRWKGGVTKEHQNQRRYAEYGVWRRRVFVNDNYTCQICGQRNGTLHADHIQAWCDNPVLRFEVKNGRTLCRFCHYYVTFKRKMPQNSTWGLYCNRKVK